MARSPAPARQWVDTGSGTLEQLALDEPGDPVPPYSSRLLVDGYRTPPVDVERPSSEAATGQLTPVRLDYKPPVGRSAGRRPSRLHVASDPHLGRAGQQTPSQPGARRAREPRVHTCAIVGSARRHDGQRPLPPCDAGRVSIRVCTRHLLVDNACRDSGRVTTRYAKRFRSSPVFGREDVGVRPSSEHQVVAGVPGARRRWQGANSLAAPTA